MSVINWSELTKSQDDSETIEQAITRLIEDHNDDAQAHLGEGQSLETHRQNEVIDHPEGSVVNDKIPLDSINILQYGGKEMNYYEIFENTTDWIKTGGTITAVLGRLRLSTGTTINTNVYAQKPIPSGSYLGNFGPVNVFDLVVDFHNFTNKEITILWGDNNGDEYDVGIGWRVKNNKLYALVYNSDEDSNIVYEEEIIGATGAGTQHLRVVHIPADEMWYFYINGVAVGSMNETPSGLSAQTNIFHFHIKNTTATNQYVDIYSAKITKLIQ